MISFSSRGRCLPSWIGHGVEVKVNYPVTVCFLPELGGRHIAALHRAGTAHPSPATTAVLNALAAAGQAPMRAS